MLLTTNSIFNIFSDLQKNYYIAETDYRVNGSILKIVQQRRLVGCAMVCVNDMNCIGFNFIAVGSDYVLCELLASPITSVSINYIWRFNEFGPGSLTVRSNFIYIVLNEHFQAILLSY